MKNNDLSSPCLTKSDFAHQVCVFIGRFRPFHREHLRIVKEALRLGQKVIIIVGSSHSARTERNPFTLAEVEKMIRSCFDQLDQTRIYVEGVADVFYDHDIWETSVRTAVSKVLSDIQPFGPNHADYQPQAKFNIALIGCNKDETSYYLQKFPEWELIPIEMKEQISATFIRKIFLHAQVKTAWKKHAADILPPSVIDFLEGFMETVEYDWLRSECAANQAHRAPFEQFAKQLLVTAGISTEVPQVAADICLVQSGHVLMSQRLVFPGKWLWQLPGTFLAPNESTLECAFRGLIEKTNVAVPRDVLNGSIRVKQSYHHPHRSMRGRILTEAYLVHLSKPNKTGGPFPKVKAPKNGRSRPWWVSLAALKPEECYEDHFPIIQDLLRRNRLD